MLTLPYTAAIPRQFPFVHEVLTLDTMLLRPPAHCCDPPPTAASSPWPRAAPRPLRSLRQPLWSDGEHLGLCQWRAPAHRLQRRGTPSSSPTRYRAAASIGGNTKCAGISILRLPPARLFSYATPPCAYRLSGCSHGRTAGRPGHQAWGSGCRHTWGRRQWLGQALACYPLGGPGRPPDQRAPGAYPAHRLGKRTFHQRRHSAADAGAAACAHR